MQKNQLQLIKAGSTSIINALGEVMFRFSLSLKLLKVTGAAFGYGTSLFIGPIIGLLISPIIGKLIDKYPHKNLALISQTLLILVLLFYSLAYKYSRLPILYSSIIAVIFINIFGRLFTITYLSSTPQIVTKDSIQRLNSLQTTGVAMASIVAAPLAGFLFGITSFTNIIILEITTEIMTLLITWRTVFQKDISLIATRTNTTKKANVLKLLRQQPNLVMITIIAMVLNLSDVSLQIGIPYILIHILKYRTFISGNVQGVSSAGVFLGGIVISLINIKNVFYFTKRIYWINTISILVLGFMVNLLPNYLLISFFVFEFIFGILGAISDPPIFTYIQQTIPQNALGRVNTLLYTVVQILNPLGVLIYSAAFSDINYRTIYLFNGLLTCIVVSVLFLILKKMTIRQNR